MSISKSESQKIQRLAKEGKQISKIRSEYFPHLSYSEIYWEAGGQSALGVKRMITNRLNSLVDANKTERKSIVGEIDALVCDLYSNHKRNQKKLEDIRRALDK